MKPKILARLFAFLILACIGCDRTAPTDQPASAESIAEVKHIAAELLGVPEERINVDVPLGRHDPPLDDLDLVELIMELEDHFQISIVDDELAREAGADDLSVMRSRLTLTSLANIVDRIKPKSG